MWTHKLPTITGWYWFRDIDNTNTNERGMAYVRLSKPLVALADILIAESYLDGDPFLSSAYWLPDEVDNDNWEWYGPIEVPK